MYIGNPCSDSHNNFGIEIGSAVAGEIVRFVGTTNLVLRNTLNIDGLKLGDKLLPSTSPSSGQILKYDLDTDKWIYSSDLAGVSGGTLAAPTSANTFVKSVSNGSGGFTYGWVTDIGGLTLSGISLSNSTPSIGQVLKYDGSSWIGSTDLTGTINAGLKSHTSTNQFIKANGVSNSGDYVWSDELRDFKLFGQPFVNSDTLVNNDVLKYNSATLVWEAGQITGGTSLPTSGAADKILKSTNNTTGVGWVDDLNTFKLFGKSFDKTDSTLVLNDVLKYNGSTWSTGSSLTSLPTTTNQFLKSTGSGTYAWDTKLNGLSLGGKLIHSTSTPASNTFLKYVSGSDWSYSDSLDGLKLGNAEFSITSLAEDDIMMYDGNVWTNSNVFSRLIPPINGPDSANKILKTSTTTTSTWGDLDGLYLNGKPLSPTGSSTGYLKFNPTGNWSIDATPPGGTGSTELNSLNDVKLGSYVSGKKYFLTTNNGGTSWINDNVDLTGLTVNIITINNINEVFNNSFSTLLMTASCTLPAIKEIITGIYYTGIVYIRANSSTYTININGTPYIFDLPVGKMIKLVAKGGTSIWDISYA